MYCFLHDDNELHEWYVCFKLERFLKRFRAKLLAASSSSEALIVAAWEHCFLTGC